MFVDYTGLTFCVRWHWSSTRETLTVIESFKRGSEEYFIKVIDFSTIETRKQSSFKKDQRYPFDSDNSRKIVESFKSRHWNEKLNSANRKQKKKIKDDRNRITTTEIIFQRKTFFRSARTRKLKSKQQSEFQKIEIARKVVSK